MVYKKLKGKYLTLRALFGTELASSTGDTLPCVKSKLCKETIFCENKHKETQKTGLVATRHRAENLHV